MRYRFEGPNIDMWLTVIEFGRTMYAGIVAKFWLLVRGLRGIEDLSLKTGSEHICVVCVPSIPVRRPLVGQNG